MDFSLTEEQLIFRNMAREFATRYLKDIAKDIDRNERFPQEIVKEMAPLGLLGLTVPQEHGGLGVDHIDYAIVTEEIAYASLSIAAGVFCTYSVVAEALATWGGEEQKRKYLPPMCKGEIFGCCALTEAGTGVDVRSFSSKAERSKEGWVLHGEKVLVLNGGVADLALTLAKVEGNGGSSGVGAFLVGRNVAGFSSQDIYARSGLRACNVANVYFRDCRLPQENLLANIDAGLKIAENLLASINLGVAAACVGAAQACIDASVKYAEERSVFGRPISNYDMIQGTIADMLVGTEAARLLTYQAANLKDKGESSSKQLAMARYLASYVALRASTNAIQVHGAYGFGKEYDVERYFRDVADLTLYGEAPSAHKLTVARSALGIGV